MKKIYFFAVAFLLTLPGYAQFQRQFGTPLDEAFTKVIKSGTNYYVLGTGQVTAGQPGQATVTRLNALGELQWTRSLTTGSRWNDAVLTPDGNLLVVGQSIPDDNTSRSIMGLITAVGTFTWVRSYDIPNRDAFTKIVRNPAPQNANFPYYVLGHQLQSLPSTDDVFLMNIDEAGNINWKKIYSSLNDDEFSNDLEVLPNGDLLLAGNWGGQGTIFRTTNAGEIFNGVSPEIPYTFVDLALANGGGFFAVGYDFQNEKVHLMRFDNDLLGLWDVTLGGLTDVSQVWQASSTGSVYVTGTKPHGSLLFQRSIYRLTVQMDGATLDWVKYLDNGLTATTGGTTSFFAPAQMAYTDGRTPSAGTVFGGFCAFISVSDLDLTTCMTQQDMALVQNVNTIYNSPEPPPIDFYDAPMAANQASAARTWQQANTCGAPCEASFTVNNVDNCGHVQVVSTSTGSLPISYQWCTGETSQNLDLQLPCGEHTFCVSITCADGTMSSASQNYTVTDNTPPVITCPENKVVEAIDPLSCNVQVEGLHWLSAIDACPLEITYTITGATSNAGQNDVSGLTFNPGISTITYTATDECGNSNSCMFTVDVFCPDLCPENIIQNPNLNIGATAGTMPSPGAVSGWNIAYGTPEVFTGLGCGDNGYIQLQGNKKTGSAVYQTLSTNIQKGKVYELHVCVRVANTSQVPYVKLRAVAFNNQLPATGRHPVPGQDTAVIDISGKIPTCADWTTFVFHRWRAPKNFAKIALNIENNEAFQVSIGDIDNICFAEVNDSIPCYLVDLDSLGNLIPPFGQLDPNCPPIEDDEDIYMGSVNDIYAYCNPAPDGLDTWYQSCIDSCASIGGELPDELVDFIENDSLNQYLADSLNIPDSTLMSDLSNFLDSLELVFPNTNLLDSMMALGPFSFDCRSLPPQGMLPNDPNSPFNGIDIVFVHGLREDALEDRLNGVPGALTKWPADRNEFYYGYWKKGAYEYWNDHTEKYLKTYVDPNTFAVTRNGNYSNRYIVVAHPTTQTFVYGAHSVIEQIGNAMINGTGVINCNPNDPRPANTFGHNGFIIISHSDGAPLSDVVLTTSHLSRFPPQGLFLGDVSFIADRCQLHVAMQGAFGGSNYAALALMAAASTNFEDVSLLVSHYSGFNITPGSANWLFSSQLVDMSITKHLWGLFMDLAPVCVLTLAGGHPTSYGLPHKSDNNFLSFAAKHVVHHGFDDGVLSLDSQTANPDFRPFYPNRFLPISGKLTHISPILNEKLFDMGINKDRGIRYYLDQKLDIKVAEKLSSPIIPSCFGVGTRRLFASSGNVPWLSPTGMVQPVLVPFCFGFPGYDALKRYHNHFSFIQSAADHFSGSMGDFPNYPNYDKTYDTGSPAFTGAANYEESRVITSPLVYTNCGVSFSRMGSLQVEYIRGKSKTIPLFRRRSIKLWIWKRFYHVLRDYESKNQVDYLYENVLK